MRVVGKCSFNDGERFIEVNHAAELQEVYNVIAKVDTTQHKTKASREKTMVGRILIQPTRPECRVHQGVSITRLGKT